MTANMTTMPPDEFKLWTWKVDGKPTNSPACKVEAGLEIKFPQNGQETSADADPKNAFDPSYRAAWAATTLTYDSRSDQYSGVMIESTGGFRYVTISFDRGCQTPRIHCYVSDTFGARGPVPDDGSWTAGGTK